MTRTSSFLDDQAAARVLGVWRSQGIQEANFQLQIELRRGIPGSLLRELQYRLLGLRGPRLLLDGIWFSRPYGGITRVWEQILSTWNLPGLITDAAPIAFIDRGNCLASTGRIKSLEAIPLDPLLMENIPIASEQNLRFVQEWGADVFCSSWISCSSVDAPACHELALVHDCLPERFKPRDPSLLPLRQRWLGSASACLSVSSDTADDLFRFYQPSLQSLQWCHPAPADFFLDPCLTDSSSRLFDSLRSRSGLSCPYLLLPSTSGLGSYKNPELVARALMPQSLSSIQLVLTGLGAEDRCRELESHFPHLHGRTLAAGFTNLELALSYQHSLAVVIPSRIEGFGLPAIEVMAAGGVPLVADSRGLREAGAEGALRFSPDQPRELSGLLELLLDPNDRAWLQQRLAGKIQSRLSRLHPDLIGLALLAQARCATNRE